MSPATPRLRILAGLIPYLLIQSLNPTRGARSVHDYLLPPCRLASPEAHLVLHLKLHVCSIEPTYHAAEISSL